MSIPIMPIIYDFPLDFYKNPDDSITVDIEKKYNSMVQFCSNHQIGITSPGLYAFCQDSTIRIYSGPQFALGYIINGFGSGSSTEWFQNEFSNATQDIINSIYEFILAAMYYAWRLHTGTEIPVQERFSNVYKTNEGDIRCYNSGTDDFLINDDWIFCNNIHKKAFQIPSELYPMPNKGPVKILYSQNTKELDDGGELAQILNPFINSTDCQHKNVELAIQTLRDNNYSHKIQFYSGWLFGNEQPAWLFGNEKPEGIPHTWIVVDDNSVIDVTMKKNDYLSTVRDLYANGKYTEFNREFSVQSAKKEQRHPKPFMERTLHYGKPKDWLYVGVKSNVNETSENNRKLLQKYPQHPFIKLLVRLDQMGQTI